MSITPHIAMLEENGKRRAIKALLGDTVSPISTSKSGCKFYKLPEQIVVDDCFHKPSLRNKINLISQSDAAVLVLEHTGKWTSDYLALLKFFKVPLIGVIFSGDYDASFCPVYADRVHDMLVEAGVADADVDLILTNLNQPQTPETLKELQATINKAKPRILASTNAIMIVDDVFRRFATSTVTGRVFKGTFETKQQVKIVGYDAEKHSVVDTIQIYNQDVPKAHASEHCGLLLRGMALNDVKAKQVVMSLDTNYIELHRFTAKIQLATIETHGRSTPITDGYSPIFYFNSVPARGIITLKNEPRLLMPGETADISVILETSIPLLSTTFLIADEDKIVGVGKILEATD